MKCPGFGWSIGIYGGFLKWGYPQIIHDKRIFHCYKPSILRYPRLWKPPYGSFGCVHTCQAGLLSGNGNRLSGRVADAKAPGVQVKLVFVHEIPLLANIKIQMPDGTIVALTSSLKLSRVEELIALRSQFVGFFKSLVC